MLPTLACAFLGPSQEIPAEESGDADTDTDADADTGWSCNPDTGGWEDTGGGPGCNVHVVFTEPTDGAEGVAESTDVTFTLDDVDATAFAGVDGVPGTSTSAGRKVIFDPDDDLESGTTYTARVCTCNGEESITFTTGSDEPEARVAVADPADLEGRTWSFDLTTGDWTEPPGVGSLFASYATNRYLVGVTGSTSTTLEVRTGWDDGAGAQDTCSMTTDGTADFSVNPDFTWAGGAGSLALTGSWDVEESSLSGWFAEDGSVIHEATVSGLWDTRGFSEEAIGTASELCDLIVSFGDSCEACSDGEDLCLRVTIEALEGDEVTPLELDEVTENCG
jgi:hypothetical protein